MRKPRRPKPEAPEVRVLFFTSAGCAPCMALKKRGTLDRIAKEFGVQLLTLELEEDEDARWHSSYDVGGLPTMVIEQRGVGALAVVYEAGEVRRALAALRAGKLKRDEEALAVGPRLWASFPESA